MSDSNNLDGTQADAEPPIIRAERHLSAGEFDAAETICNAMFREGHQPGHALYLLGLIASHRNDLETAYGHLTEALEMHPAAPRMRHDLASICARMGRVEEAEEHLQFLLARHPNDAGTFEHLALLQQRRGRSEEAIASFRRALDVNPDSVAAHQALGGLLYQRGELAAALPHLRALRQFKPAGEDRYQMLGLALLSLGHSEELAALDPRSARTAGQRFNETVLRALLAWQDGDFAQCETLIDQAEPFSRVPDSAPNRKVFTTYFKYLQRLLAFHTANKKRYAEPPADTVYAVGDSHCIMAGHLPIPIGGVPHRVQPCLAFGCKAFHLTSPNHSPYRSAFEAALDRLPEGATVISTLGELDLRYSEGIMSFLRKSPEADPEATAASLAAAYVARLQHLAAPRGLRLIVMSPPASNVKRQKLPEDDRETFDRVIAAFNERLRAATAEAGLSLIDLFGATRDADGQTIAKHYVDPNHVRPTVFLEAAAAAQL